MVRGLRFRSKVFGVLPDPIRDPYPKPEHAGASADRSRRRGSGRSAGPISG